MLAALLLQSALATPIPTRVYDCVHVAPPRPYVERTVVLRVEGAGRLTGADVVQTMTGASLIRTATPRSWPGYDAGAWTALGFDPWRLGVAADVGYVVLLPGGVLGSTMDIELHEHYLVAGGWLQDVLTCTAR